MIELDKEYLYLPKEFWKQHNQCERLINQIESFLTDSSFSDLRISKIELSSEHEIKKDEHILDFLLRTNRVDEHDKFVTNILIDALIIDTCYFLQEALLSSKKQRLTVTFALLRKPFIYHLLVFLRIMFEEKFIEKFNSQDLFDSTRLDDGDKRVLIRLSLPCLMAAKSMTEDDIFNFIFNQENQDSIINISNKALHLSTTRNKNNKTEIQNMNMIFANPNDIKNLWSYFYRRLPILLLYYLEIIEALVFSRIDLPAEKYKQRIEERLDILSK